MEHQTELKSKPVHVFLFKARLGEKKKKKGKKKKRFFSHNARHDIFQNCLL